MARRERIGHPLGRVGRFVVVHRIVAVASGVETHREGLAAARLGRELQPCRVVGENLLRLRREGDRAARVSLSVGRCVGIDRVFRIGMQSGERGGRHVARDRSSRVRIVAFGCRLIGETDGLRIGYEARHRGAARRNGADRRYSESRGRVRGGTGPAPAPRSIGKFYIPYSDSCGCRDIPFGE